jgi:hypothetical protein
MEGFDAVDDLGHPTPHPPGDGRYGPWSTPARRPTALQLVVVEPLRRLVAPCRTPRGTHSKGRSTAGSRLNRGRCRGRPVGIGLPIERTPGCESRRLCMAPRVPGRRTFEVSGAIEYAATCKPDCGFACRFADGRRIVGISSSRTGALSDHLIHSIRCMSGLVPGPGLIARPKRLCPASNTESGSPVISGCQVGIGWPSARRR